MRFGEVLMQMLDERGMSQRQLAKKSGLSPQHINRLCVGRVEEPTLSNGFKIADALGVPLAEIQERMERG